MTRTVKLPGIIEDKRLSDSILYILSLSRRLGDSSETITLDWERVADISPAGLAILCCLFDSFVEQGNRIKCVNVSRKHRSIPVTENLLKAREFSFLPNPNIQNYEGRDVILRGNALNLDILFRERLEKKFSDKLDEEILYAVMLITNGLMQNAVDHSTAERYYLYAGFWKNEFHVGLLDMGISVPAKLEQRYTCSDDLEYLELALKKGTGTRRERPGGFGLFYFFDFLKAYEGKLTVLSRRAQIRRYFKTRRSQRSILRHTLFGTWCFARFPLR